MAHRYRQQIHIPGAFPGTSFDLDDPFEGETAAEEDHGGRGFTNTNPSSRLRDMNMNTMADMKGQMSGMSGKSGSGSGMGKGKGKESMEGMGMGMGMGSMDKMMEMARGHEMYDKDAVEHGNSMGGKTKQLRRGSGAYMYPEMEENMEGGSGAMRK